MRRWASTVRRLERVPVFWPTIAAVDFEDSPELADFRAEVRAFLDAHAELRRGDERDWSRNSAATDPEVAEEFRTPLPRVATHAVRQRVGRAHLAGDLRRPGSHLRSPDRVQPGAGTLRREQPASSPLPRRSSGPTLMAHGTPQQQERYLAPLLAGEETWCQLFSEPGAGSDLASLATRAVLTATSGSWTARRSGPPAHSTPTSGSSSPAPIPDAPKHKGITYFIARHGHARHRGASAGPGAGRGALQRGVPVAV